MGILYKYSEQKGFESGKQNQLQFSFLEQNKTKREEFLRSGFVKQGWRQWDIN